MSAVDVTICIPTWQAEPFIRRTLQCARVQTHANVRILVSIDRCDDGTETICRDEASKDPRIEIIAQNERLGWAENANFLLDKVDTELFFLYFHDDIIDPDYTAKLRQALFERPDAKSAHCDMERLGNKNLINKNQINIGQTYDGPDSRRLMQYLVGPNRGWLLLRGLIRSELLRRGLRFPAIPGDGNWKVPPFLMRLFAAGPALYVPGALYKRWMHDGSMTTKWKAKSVEELVQGQQGSSRLCLEIIDRIDASVQEKELVRFCLYVFMMTRTRRQEIALRRERLIAASTISNLFAFPHVPETIGTLEPDLLQAVLNDYGTLMYHEGIHALKRRQRDAALVKLGMAVALNPKSAQVRKAVDKLLAPRSLADRFLQPIKALASLKRYFK